MNDWKKILIIIGIILFLFATGFTTATIIHRGSLGKYQDTIADIRGRNTELLIANRELEDSNIRLGESVKELNGLLDGITDRVEKAKGIVEELGETIDSAEDRIRVIIEAVEQLIEAIANL